MVVDSLKALRDLQELSDEGPEIVSEGEGDNCKGKALTCPFPLVWIPGQKRSLIQGRDWYCEIEF